MQAPSLHIQLVPPSFALLISRMHIAKHSCRPRLKLRSSNADTLSRKTPDRVSQVPIHMLFLAHIHQRAGIAAAALGLRRSVFSLMQSATSCRDGKTVSHDGFQQGWCLGAVWNGKVQA